MTAKVHNKKRNVGIIYEQLLRSVAKFLVEGKEQKREKTLFILKAHFRPGSELYKEFRLFNALVKTSVESDSLATRILGEAKHAAMACDATRLRNEKAKLIKEINLQLDDANFYNQRIQDYRSYATIQTLLNDWRGGPKSDLGRIAKYENQMVKWLTTEKIQYDNTDLNKNNDINRLTVKIMSEKFNKKYAGSMSDEQSDIIQEYVIYRHSGQDKILCERLETMKNDAINELSIFVEASQNKVLYEKFNHVKNNIVTVSTSQINDKTISKFLLISKLRAELLENDNE
jgi:hypothetical protein